MVVNKKARLTFPCKGEGVKQEFLPKIGLDISLNAGGNSLNTQIKKGPSINRRRAQWIKEKKANEAKVSHVTTRRHQ